MYRFRGKSRGGRRVNLVKRVLFYMDDILLIGTNAKNLHAAAKMVAIKAAEMGLTIKNGWRVFKIADKKGSPGSFIDMMGFRFYKNCTTIRRRVFRRLRKSFLRAWKRRKQLSVHAAQRCVAYFGFTQHTNSFTFCRKYHVYEIIKIAKEVISRASKISGTAAAGADC